MHIAEPRYYSCETKSPASHQADTSTHNRVIDFINRTSVQIVVIDRNNIPTFLPPAPAGTNLMNPCVEVRVRYNTYGDHNLKAVYSGLEMTAATVGPLVDDRLEFYRSLGDNINGRQVINFNSTLLVREIPFKDLIDARVLFDKASGFVFCVENYHVETLHPESLKGRELAGHQDYVKGRPTGTLFEIVDNQRMYKERFTFASNQVLRIPTVVDSQRPDGVYVTTVTDVGRSESTSECKRLTMAEASVQYGLYATREEAESAGNPELLVKNRHTELIQTFERTQAEFRQKEIELKHLLTVSEAENKKKILELESQANERALEIKKLKDQLDARRAVRDDYYDERSTAREETKEWLKVVPLVLAAFCGGALLARR